VIHLAIAEVVTEVNAYLNLRSPALTTNRVVSGSLFDLQGSPNAATRNRIVVEIVNLEKDAVYRSIETYRTRPDGTHERIRPSVRINAFVLFIANLDDYPEALKAISLVIAFFQNRYSFDVSANGDGSARVVFELYSMTFEEQNHLWASLGAKYMPSVVYKAAILDIRDTQVDAEVPPVEEISTTG
jgi:uncharacterized protein DUF4255